MLKATKVINYLEKRGFIKVKEKDINHPLFNVKEIIYSMTNNLFEDTSFIKFSVDLTNDLISNAYCVIEGIEYEVERFSDIQMFVKTCLEVNEKKSNRKSLKESFKPINEKNVESFVNEVNEWCDEHIHYVDEDATRFTKKYGKMYNFKYRIEDDTFIIYDSEETLDLFDREASMVYSTLDKLAKKNGWYIDPYSCACDFTFGEI